MMCGGHSGLKEPDQEMRDYFAGAQEAVHAKAGQSFDRFELVGYTSQVVAGTIYWAKIKVSDADTGFIHVKIFQALPYTGAGPDVQIVHLGQSEGEAFNVSAQ
jgi:hypothetical protein